MWRKLHSRFKNLACTIEICGFDCNPSFSTTDISGGIFFILNVLPAQCEHGCKHGECVGPNKCKCFPGYSGKTCNQGGYLRSLNNVWKANRVHRLIYGRIHFSRKKMFICSIDCLQKVKIFLILRPEWVRPETSSMWASLHEHLWELQMLLSQRIHLNGRRILCQWVPMWIHTLSGNAENSCISGCISDNLCYFVFGHVDSRTCALAHCQYGCEEVQGEIQCLCPSAGLQLGQDGRTCVGER